MKDVIWEMYGINKQGSAAIAGMYAPPNMPDDTIKAMFEAQCPDVIIDRVVKTDSERG